MSVELENEARAAYEAIPAVSRSTMGRCVAALPNSEWRGPKHKMEKGPREIRLTEPNKFREGGAAAPPKYLGDKSTTF